MPRLFPLPFTRPLIALDGQRRGAPSLASGVSVRSRLGALAGLVLLALLLAGLLWPSISRASETTLTGDRAAGGAAGLAPSAPAWLAPLAAPFPLASRGLEPPLSAQAKSSVRDAYARLPLGLVENAGQLDRRVRYYAKGQGFGFYFTRREAVLSFTKRPAGGRGATARGTTLALGFLGARRAARVSAEAQLPGKVNYLLGDDPSKWRTGLSTYASVRYEGLWPGVDLVLEGRGGRLKYELHVAPGADVGDIRLAYRGAEGLSLSPSGALRIETPLGVLRDSRPVSYQRVGGRRVPVASRYRLDPRRRNAYGFALDAGYDPNQPLVIDPALVYSTYLGGGASDASLAVAVDSAGSAYLTGGTSSSDFPTTPGAFDTTPADLGQLFVTKMNASGSALSYSTYLGSGEADDVAVDSAGSAYVTGQTFSGDFPTSPGAHDRTFNGGGADAFVTKLDPSGSALSYSTFLGGGNGDLGVGIALDASGSAHVAGQTFSGDFPTTPGAHDTTFNGGDGDAFVTKLNPSGSALSYSTYLGGGSRERGLGVAVDPGGRAYVTGDTQSSDFPSTPGAFDTTLAGSDAFVTKLNPSGALSYSTYLGGVSFDQGLGITVDAGGSAYVTGAAGGGFPTTVGAYDTTANGRFDAFVAKLNTAGSALSYSTYLGGGSEDVGDDIVVDAGGGAHLTGVTESSDFPVTPGALDTSLGAFVDAFVTKLNAGGSSLSYSTYLGGGDSDRGFGIALDAQGSAYVTGATDSFDFPTTPGAFETTANGFGDAFVTKLNLKQCSDGRDNDGDGRIDFPADPGCSSAFDDDERDPVTLIPVRIDIKPGDAGNRINLRSRGVIPVAILTTQGFDARTVDVRTVCFGDAENPFQRACAEAHGRGHLEDVDGDGKLDLVLHFRTRETGIDEGDTSACLSGAALQGRRIEGCDSIRTDR